MKMLLWGIMPVVMVLLICLGGCAGNSAVTTGPAPDQEEAVKLPEPKYQGPLSVEEGILKRRSVRTYADQPLTLAEVGQLLWAAQGITGENGLRAAPSAGALYPLELYVLAGRVTGLAQGFYRYDPGNHQIIKKMDGDRRAELAAASLGQNCVKDGAAVFVITAVYERTTGKYGDRGERYVHLETGHAAQNLCLEATALGLGAVTVGAFDDMRLKELLGLSIPEQPLYLVPVGRIGS